jgi:hypothetical protein
MLKRTNNGLQNIKQKTKHRGTPQNKGLAQVLRRGNKGNNKITELRTILQRESLNS